MDAASAIVDRVRGVVYVAYGARACKEVIASVRTLREWHDWPVAVIGDGVALAGQGMDPIGFQEAWTAEAVQASRWAKVNLDRLMPAEWTEALYIDADTRIRDDLSAGFAILEDGWDMAMAPSAYQGTEVMHHVGAEERRERLSELGPDVLALQAGLFFWHRERCREFFDVWREEWKRWRGQDQGAFLQAYRRTRPRLWLLGLPWNSRGGAIVQHCFGKARQGR